MSIGLDLSASRAKVNRARVHEETLKSEIPRFIEEAKSHSVTAGEIDQQTGRVPIHLEVLDARDPIIGAVLGDLVHNLRSALDFIVSALADASGIRVTTKHQFPIFRSRTAYEKSVEKPKRPDLSCLHGIVHGLDLIEVLQPYKLKPDPEADPLWHLHRFSNADKHRELAPFLPLPQGGDLDVTYEPWDCQLIEATTVSPRKPWDVGVKQEIAILRFDPPYPAKLNINSKTRVEMFFATSAIGNEPQGIAIDLGSVEHLSEHVSMIIDLFQLL